MTKRFEIIGLDCAICAGKLETALNKLDGVQAKIGFLTETLTVTADDGIFDARLGEVKKLIKKLEPGTKVRDK